MRTDVSWLVGWGAVIGALGAPGCLLDWTVPEGGGGAGGARTSSSSTETLTPVQLACDPVTVDCECAEGEACAISCATCAVHCLAGSECTVDCGSQPCTVTCDEGATCHVACESLNFGCVLECDPGASCSNDCPGDCKI